MTPIVKEENLIIEIGYSSTASIKELTIAPDDKNEIKEVLFAQVIVSNKETRDFTNDCKTRDFKSISPIDGTITKVNFSGTNVTGIKRIEGTHYSLITLATRKLFNPEDMNQQFFLTDNSLSEEDKEEQIKNEFFFNRLNSKLPFPLKEEWKPSFWVSIKTHLIKCENLTNSNSLAVYKLDMPTLDVVSNYIRSAHSESEFKEYHNFLPKNNLLLELFDIKRFKQKTWTPFFKSLEEKGFTREENIISVRLWEIFQDIDLPFNEDIRQAEHTSYQRGMNMFLRCLKTTQEVQSYRQFITTIVKWTLSNNSDKLISNKSAFLTKVFDNHENLFKEQRTNVKNKNFAAIVKFLSLIIYSSVEEGKEDLAEYLGLHGVSESDFHKYEDLWNTSVFNKNKAYEDALNEYEILAEQKKVTIELLMSEDELNKDDLSTVTYKKDNIRAFFEFGMDSIFACGAGHATNCCQVVSGLAKECLYYASANPTVSGVFVVLDKGKMIAQSFWWLSDEKENGDRDLCFDNIEFLGNSSREDILAGRTSAPREKVTKAYKAIVEEIANNAIKLNIANITFGSGYLESWMTDISSKKIDSTNPTFIKRPTGLKYSDAKSTQFVLASNLKNKLRLRG